MPKTLIKDQAIDPTARLQSKTIAITRDMSLGAGSVSYTGVGFKPTALIAMADQDGTGFFNWGFCDSALGLQSMQRAHDGNFYASGQVYLIQIDIASGQQVYCTVTSFDADGFTLNWLKAGSPTGTINAKIICFR